MSVYDHDEYSVPVEVDIQSLFQQGQEDGRFIHQIMFLGAWERLTGWQHAMCCQTCADTGIAKGPKQHCELRGVSHQRLPLSAKALRAEGPLLSREPASPLRRTLLLFLSRYRHCPSLVSRRRISKVSIPSSRRTNLAFPRCRQDRRFFTISGSLVCSYSSLKRTNAATIRSFSCCCAPDPDD